MRKLLLLLSYWLLVTPVALAVRIVHDPLNRRVDRSAATYWTTR